MGVYNYLGEALVNDLPIVNVKDYGAQGDGTTIDTSAIQQAISSVSSLGGVVYFPSGVYLLDASVLFYSNQQLVFEPGAVLKQGAAINNLLMTYCAADTTVYNGTHDCVIFGATFDGSTYTTNNTLVGLVHAKNITFENCKFFNAYGTWHNIEINSSYNVKLINCEFEGSRKTGANGEMIQIDAINNADTWPWDSNRGQIDGTVSKCIEICGCLFRDNTVTPAIGNHSQIINQYINIHDNTFVGLTTTRGVINLQNSLYVDVHNNVFDGCTTCVSSYGPTHWVHDNAFVSVTTAASGSSSIVHNNIINGTYTA